MPEFFVTGSSFPAPFCGDPIESFVEAETPAEALQRFVDSCPHPFGVYSAEAFRSSDAQKKGERALARYCCNELLVKEEVTRGLGSYSLGRTPEGDLLINGKAHKVVNPKGGRVVPC